LANNFNQFPTTQPSFHLEQVTPTVFYHRETTSPPSHNLTQQEFDQNRFSLFLQIQKDYPYVISLLSWFSLMLSNLVIDLSLPPGWISLLTMFLVGTSAFIHSRMHTFRNNGGPACLLVFVISLLIQMKILAWIPDVWFSLYFFVHRTLELFLSFCLLASLTKHYPHFTNLILSPAILSYVSLTIVTIRRFLFVLPVEQIFQLSWGTYGLLSLFLFLGIRNLEQSQLETRRISIKLYGLLMVPVFLVSALSYISSWFPLYPYQTSESSEWVVVVISSALITFLALTFEHLRLSFYPSFRASMCLWLLLQACLFSQLLHIQVVRPAPFILNDTNSSVLNETNRSVLHEM